MVDSVLPKVDVPNWLREVEQSGVPNRLPLADIVKDSLYYPASGLNGTPVKFLGGFVHSFIYADYIVRESTFLSDLNGSRPEAGFAGYHSVFQRSVTTNEIVPPGWNPPILPESRAELQRLRRCEERCQPFGHWSLWRRNAELSDDHGPELFSFLFFAGEMSAIYQGIYNRLAIAPKVLAIIQPGAMGGEWESVTGDQSFFKKVVSQNMSAFPEYLLYGGYGGKNLYQEPCWYEYKGNKLIRLPERSAGLWKLTT